MRKKRKSALRRRYGRSGGDGWKRVGVAFSRPHGPNHRRDEYGIYESPSMVYGMPSEPRLYTQYEGYREKTSTGERMVGLPLGGPRWSPPQKLEFKLEHFGEVRFFDGRSR